MRTCELTNVQKVLHVLLTTHSILTIDGILYGFQLLFKKKWSILTDDKIPFDNYISTHLICQDQESAITNMDGFVIYLAVCMLSGSERKTKTNNLT